jgi:hypothetical protein
MTTTRMAVVRLAPRAESSTLCYVSAADYARFWCDDAVPPRPARHPRRVPPVQLLLPFDLPDLDEDDLCITPI